MFVSPYLAVFFIIIALYYKDIEFSFTHYFVWHRTLYFLIWLIQVDMYLLFIVQLLKIHLNCRSTAIIIGKVCGHLVVV